MARLGCIDFGYCIVVGPMLRWRPLGHKLTDRAILVCQEQFNVFNKSMSLFLYGCAWSRAGVESAFPSAPPTKSRAVHHDSGTEGVAVPRVFHGISATLAVPCANRHPHLVLFVWGASKIVVALIPVVWMTHAAVFPHRCGDVGAMRAAVVICDLSKAKHPPV